MQFAATIAVVLSVLVLAFQARELAGQSRVANEVAGTQAHREIVFHWASVIAPAFMRYPELSAYYFDETTATPSASERVRLKVIATQHADFLEVGLTTSRQLRSYVHDTGDWDDYATHRVAASAPLRSIIRDSPGLWPTLEPLVASYDAARPTLPAPPNPTAADAEGV
jgi:hypothetical protein